MSILFIGKNQDPFSLQAATYLTEKFPDANVVWSSKSTPIPKELYSWKGEYLFSYLSQWIIPKPILDNVQHSAINWHPGSPDYPGIGCTNFAIYNEEKEFGITCHHMNPKVDTGKIIDVRYFPISENETVKSLTIKCYAHILASFLTILDHIESGKDLPQSDLNWTRKPYTRKQLNALCELKLDMDEIEVARRIKATTFDRYWAYYKINGKKFLLTDED